MFHRLAVRTAVATATAAAALALLAAPASAGAICAQVQREVVCVYR